MDMVCTQHPDSMAQLKVPQLRRILQHVRRKRGKSHQGAHPDPLSPHGLRFLIASYRRVSSQDYYPSISVAKTKNKRARDSVKR
jgi:hypothetical protein